MPKNAVRTRFEGGFSIESTRRRHEGKPDVCFYFVVKVDGKRQWHKVGWRSEGYTATVAHELRNQHVQGLRYGQALPSQKKLGQGLSFEQAWETYDKRHLCNLQGANVVRCYVKLHLLPIFQGRSLATISALEVEALKNKLLAAGFAAQTVKHILAFLDRIFKKTAAWGLHSLPSPTQGVVRPKIDNARKRYLTRDEANILLTDLRRRSLVWHDIAVLSLTTGARLTEIRTLACGRVNILGGVMEVKGKTGWRMVQLSDVAKAILSPRLGDSPTALVFPSPSGGVMDASANSFKRAVVACKLNMPDTPPLQRVVFHTLRHTFASWLAIDGFPLLVIAELMGHSTLEMTKRYSHLCPEQKQQAVNAISISLQGIIPASVKN